MNKTTLNLYLVASILLLSLIPLATSFILLDDILKSVVDLGLNEETRRILNDYRGDLRKLANLDPTNQNHYRTRFDLVSDEIFVYENSRGLTGILQRTYLTYYVVLFVFTLLIAIIVTSLLGKKISASYKKLYMDDMRKSVRLKELEHFDEWQALAAKLAHEVKNPLTPIEVMVSNITKVYDVSNKQEFRVTLENTRETVMIEIDKIKRLVNHFARFSKLPEPELEKVCIVTACENFITQYRDGWEGLALRLTTDIEANRAFVLIDSILLNQCFLNLVTNAAEANPGKLNPWVNFSVTIPNPRIVEVTVFNNGATIAETDRKNIFRMYVTSKTGKENFGLGLPICRKIVLDLGGDIECLDVTEGAAFRITLPIVSSTKLSEPVV